MKYENITRATFLRRPNRFIAEVMVDGKQETVHVKNTGRCKELLIPGCEVWLTAPGTPGRKTKYDLVAVRKSTGGLFNIDSQAPNKVVKEWLATKDYEVVIQETTGAGFRCVDSIVLYPDTSENLLFFRVHAWRLPDSPYRQPIPKKERARLHKCLASPW